MCDCNVLQSRLDCVVAELRAEQEDNKFLRKRRIELRKENYRIADLEAEVKALREMTHELNEVRATQLADAQAKSKAHVELFKMRRKWTPHVNGAKPAWERCDTCSLDEACSCR